MTEKTELARLLFARDTFTFFRSWYDTGRLVFEKDPDGWNRYINAIIELALNGETPRDPELPEKLAISQALPLVLKRNQNKINGTNGGAPAGNQNAKKGKTTNKQPNKQPENNRPISIVKDSKGEYRSVEDSTGEEGIGGGSGEDAAASACAGKSEGGSVGPYGPQRTTAPDININLKGPPATPEEDVKPPGAGGPYTLEECKQIARQNTINITLDGLKAFLETNNNKGWRINGQPVQLVRAMRGFIKRNPVYEAHEPNILSDSESDDCENLIERYLPTWLQTPDSDPIKEIKLLFWDNYIEPYPELIRAIVYAYVPRRAFIGFSVSLDLFQRAYGVNLTGEPKRDKDPTMKDLRKHFNEFLKS